MAKPGKRTETTDSQTTKYIQISSDIIRRIRTGKLSPGMKVPSENEIIEEYGVSNTTARKALQYIELQGYVRRQKGRGTFVIEGGVARSANRILSFTKNMQNAGFAPSTRVLHTEVMNSEVTLDIQGRQYTLHAPVNKIHRLRFADNIPMLLEIRYISSSLCPNIIEHDLNGSLYELYENVYGLHLSKVKQKLTAIILDSLTMDFFNLTDETPGIMLESVTFCGTDTPLELERSVYRGDKYQFIVSATE